MPEAFQAEFTGERVIPGRVEDNLFNEHLARYRFTARLARGLGGRFLDAGCGAGYGAAELAAAGEWVLGMDISGEAIGHARANYGVVSNLRFVRASCTAIPAVDASFRLITAFEVIEHLEGWREFLAETRRVLAPGGLFLVSTPNQLYYAESRKKAGPNPFHVHEFTEAEFRYELQNVFPHVTVLLQNHVEGIAFSGAEAEGVALEISQRTDDPAGAHFFLAVCGSEPLPAIERFVFIPTSGNVLQTRERHIALLEGEIQQKNQWIEAEKIAGGRMEEKVRSLEKELEEHNRWARLANQEADRRARLVTELQAELSKSNAWAKARDAEAVERGQRVEQLQGEVAQATEWARARDAEAAARALRVEQLQEEVAQATEWARSRDAEAEERGQRVVQLQEEFATEQANAQAAIEQWQRDKAVADQWALETERLLKAEQEALAGKQVELESAQQEIALLRGQMGMIAQSRWVRLGRSFRVGPEIEQN